MVDDRCGNRRLAASRRRHRHVGSVGFAVALWIREIVHQLIAARSGVVLTVASVGRTLHDLGFSAQRPLYRAEQADPVTVRRWKETDYPQIAADAKTAARRGRRPGRSRGRPEPRAACPLLITTTG
jgi:Winged helix-turn helix